MKFKLLLSIYENYILSLITYMSAMRIIILCCHNISFDIKLVLQYKKYKLVDLDRKLTLKK